MDKWNVVYSYNGTLFCRKKDENTDTGYNVDGPWKHWAKWEKPVTDHVLYDYVYVKCPE